MESFVQFYDCFPRRVLDKSFCDIKILGFPVSISNEKYQRNHLMFNICLVFASDTYTTHYEPIVKKLNHYLRDLEVESAFISVKGNDKELPHYMEIIKETLNKDEICVIPVCKFSLFL